MDTYQVILELGVWAEALGLRSPNSDLYNFDLFYLLGFNH